MLPKDIKKFEDLITTHSEIKKGFLSQAIKKGEISEPIIKNAKKFYIALNGVDNLEKVLSLDSFQEELISAAGFSQKSLNHLSKREIKDSLKKVFLKLFKNKNEFFREEIVYRYLLTKGDSLGGSMRNIVGAAAGERLTKILLFILKKKKYKPKISRNGAGKVNNISWNNRFLIFDYKPRMIGNNIDIILFDTLNTKSINEIFDNPNRYLACGELKGGIDPAGADEHWKTANHALERIRTSFAKEKNKPKLFFIGAAIEQAMAKEIFSQLEADKLSNAANLNQKKQMFDLADWLTNL